MGKEYGIGNGLVSEAERVDLLKRYDAWHATRQVLSSNDGHPVDGPSPDDWHSSDSDAVDLLHELAIQYRLTDECGHGSAEVVKLDGRYLSSCGDCDTTWDADGRVVEVPDADDLTWARDDLGEDATEDDVYAVAARRVRERNAEKPS